MSHRIDAVNFLPDSYVQRVTRQREHRLWRLSLVLIVALSAGATAWQVAWSMQVRRHIWALERQSALVEQTRGECRELEAEFASLQQALHTRREVQQPISVRQTLALLGSLVDPTITLQELSIEAARPRPAAVPDPDARDKPSSGSGGDAKRQAPEPYRLELVVVGVAPSDRHVAGLVETLEARSLFEDVRLRRSRPASNEPAALRRFELTLRVPLRREIQVIQTGAAGPRASRSSKAGAAGSTEGGA